MDRLHALLSDDFPDFISPGSPARHARHQYNYAVFPSSPLGSVVDQNSMPWMNLSSSDTFHYSSFNHESNHESITLDMSVPSAWDTMNAVRDTPMFQLQSPTTPNFVQPILTNDSETLNILNKCVVIVDSPPALSEKKEEFPQRTKRRIRQSKKVCENCATEESPAWRRDTQGRLLCNACGLYFKLHHQDREFRLNDGEVKVIRRSVQKE